MIVLTNEYTKRQAAAAVPGSGYVDRNWVLPNPTPRAAAVALKLFPELAGQYPELVELRAELNVDARPVDYSAKLNLAVNSPRLDRTMGERGWSLDSAQVTPIGSDNGYQRRDLGYAAACLRQNGGFYLGWDRGLGKTLGAIALMDDLDTIANMVIAPNTAKQNTWAEELKWAAPWLEVFVMPNDAKRREECLSLVMECDAQAKPFVLITHYESLALIAGKKKQGKSWRIMDGWKKLGIQWDLMVADEGHRFANPKTQQSKAAASVPRLYTLVLSGSVFQNKWEELFGPLKLMFPQRYVFPRRDWSNRYLDYVNNGYADVCIGPKMDKVDQMRDELGRVLVLREKESKAIAQTVRVPLSMAQQAVYNDLAENLIAELPDGQSIYAENGISLLGKLRQCASGLDAFGDISDSIKLDLAVELVEKSLAKGNEIVVFTWYKSIGRALAARLWARGIEVWVVDGDVPQKERDARIKAFQDGSGRVMIGSIATMGESVNLQRANHVIRIDRAFNPALNLQAVDRVDRQGQKRDVYLTDIVAMNTVDETVVMPNLANKLALRAVIFGEQT